MNCNPISYDGWLGSILTAVVLILTIGFHICALAGLWAIFAAGMDKWTDPGTPDETPADR